MIASLLWLLGAASAGFFITKIFSDLLKWNRSKFLIPYVGLITVFLWVYFDQTLPDGLGYWLHNWQWGVLVTIPVCFILIRNVNSQPASQTSKGMLLYFEALWFGFVYGLIDGIYLNVFPVLVVETGIRTVALNQPLFERAAEIILGLAASLLITFTYHSGYAEFRWKKMETALLGNAVITAAYLISGNPLSAAFCHTAMHIAAVIRGPETTVQLPPHTKIS